MGTLIGILGNIKKSYDEKEIIILKAIRGDDESFLKIMKENKEYLYKTAFIYMKNETDSLEVIDEAVYKAYKQIRKLKNPEYFKTWITRIVINISLDKIKAKNKLIPTDEVISLVVDNKNLTIEEKLDLKDALNKLNPKYKRALILQYYNNLTLEEISIVMNCTVSAVKNYIHRGKKSLSEILKEDYLNE